SVPPRAPADAGDLVRERHGRHVVTVADGYLFRPAAEIVGLVRHRAGALRGARAVNEQHAQVAAPLAGDRSPVAGRAAGTLSRGEAEPPGIVAPGPEAVDVSDEGHQRA